MNGITASPMSPVHQPVWQQPTWRRRVRTSLLRWFDRSARQLPWRSDPTPYRVWISEIMLQQTQVATVLPYYQRFLEAFPDVASLAAADEPSLLSHWEGLGYYRRARSMHAAAKQIVAVHDGQFPTSYDDVLALPGIGRYTAGAILSISKDQRLPIVEGNTQRVFSRWVAMRGPATDTAANRLLWEIATAMLPRRGVGIFNQAAMELGALICTPKAPQCEQCPVAKDCCARAAGLQAEIPGKVSRVSYQDRAEFAMVIAEPTARSTSAETRYLVRPLPAGGRWAGLWDFPRTTEDSLPSVQAAADQLGRDLGVEIHVGARLTTIKHAVTKYRISLQVHRAELAHRKRKPLRPWRFVTLQQMETLPMSVTGRKIARLIANDSQQVLPFKP